MKHKLSLLLTIGALAFGGTAAGLVGAKSAQLTKATTTDTVVLRGKIGGVDYWSADYRTFTYNSTTSRFELTVYLSADDAFKVVDTTTSKWAGYHTDLGTSVVKGESGAIGDNIIALAAGNYTISVADFGNYGNASYVFQTATGSITYAVATTVTVTEYAVVDGAKETTAIGTKNTATTEDFTPGDVLRTGYSLDGWFTDEACTTAYVATKLTADTALYAKYTSLVDKKYVYFSAPSGWTGCYAYTFGGKQGLGAFPGTQTTLATHGAAYQGSGIYKVLFYGDANDTEIIFNNGTGGTKGTTQTYDLSLTENMFYKLVDTSTGDADRGLGAAVVYDINAARKAVTASSPILAESICGISKATATTLVGEYDALNSTAKSYVDAATDYVYDYTDTSKSTTVSFTAIIAQLRLIAASSTSPAAGITLDNNTTPVLVMVISLGVAALAAGGLWMSRRKER